ncbi:type II toxin-antitoxin system RelE/ParE family toxin [Roseateles chitinivorans]|uniref:type II toxin-antitoxin system RelE/ParE family toxin n=1 Tax=Roseateles chitinivorans TaxID=2917965 RepID=UPI003D679A76
MGSGLVKKRIARSGAGKRGGFRALVANRPGGPWFFIMGFAKSATVNIDSVTLKMCRVASRELFAMSADALADEAPERKLKEVICDSETQERDDQATPADES